MLDQLETLDAEGNPPVSRIQKADSAYQIWQDLRMADAISDFDRAKWDAMYNCVPPLNPNELIANNEAYRVNVAFPIAPQLLEAGQAGYVDIINSTEVLFDCPTTYGAPDDREELESVVAEEVTNCIRSWREFNTNFLQLTSIFIKQAVGVGMFRDEYDWRWDAYGLSDFKIPRKTKIGQENIDICCFLRFYSATELYQYIKDPEMAEKLGYDVEAVKKVIIDYVNSTDTFSRWRNYEWEKLEVELRNNDYFWTYGTSSTNTIRVVHMYWTEFDGRISSAMIYDDEKTEDFLYYRVGRFKDSYEAFTVFTSGVGTNGYYHGIRGQGYIIYPIVQALNRAYCLSLELAMFGSAPIFQPNDESAMEQMQFTPMGIYSLITPGITLQPNSIAPNLGNGILPTINNFSMMLKSMTASSQTEQIINDSKEQTKYEIQAKQGAEAKLSVASMNLFYDPFETLMREKVKRMKRKDYAENEQGGKYIQGLHKRLLDRGNGDDRYLQAFFKLDTERLTIRRAIGAGSSAARMLAFDRLMSLYGTLDAQGQATLLRDVVAESVGYRNAGRYAPPQSEGQRPTIEVSIAQLQNNALLANQIPPPMVLPNDNHLVHAQVHLSAEDPLIQQLEQQMAQDPMGSVPLLMGLNALNQHTTQHVEILSQNPKMQPQSAQMRKAINNADEILSNSIKHVARLQRDAQQKEQEAQMEQQAQGGMPQQQQQQGPQIPPDILMKLQGEMELRRAKIDTINQIASAKQNNMIAEGALKRSLMDAEAAMKIRNS